MTSEAQDMLDSRALELAAAADARASELITEHREHLKADLAWKKDHEDKDDARFHEVQQAIHKGFAGVYARLWWIVGGAFASLFAVMLFLASRVVG